LWWPANLAHPNNNPLTLGKKVSTLEIGHINLGSESMARFRQNGVIIGDETAFEKPIGSMISLA
jgi:hypothetical protein